MPENAGIRTRRPAPIAGDPLQHGQEAGALGHRIGPAHCRIVELGLDHIIGSQSPHPRLRSVGSTATSTARGLLARGRAHLVDRSFRA